MGCLIKVDTSHGDDK